MDFNRVLPRFVKVLPTDYKRVLDEIAKKETEAKAKEYPLPLLQGSAVREMHETSREKTQEKEAKEHKKEQRRLERERQRLVQQEAKQQER